MQRVQYRSRGLVASLVRLGFSEPAARHYYESLRRRQVMIAVEAPDNRARNAVELMRRLGARAVEEAPTLDAPRDPAVPASTNEAVVDHVTVSSRRRAT